jgi:hypothetical protein
MQQRIWRVLVQLTARVCARAKRQPQRQQHPQACHSSPQQHPQQLTAWIQQRVCPKPWQALLLLLLLWLERTKVHACARARQQQRRQQHPLACQA